MIDWTALAFHFLTPTWIRAAAFDSSGRRVGIVFYTETNLIAGIWELKPDGPVNQQNFACDKIGEFITMKWTTASPDFDLGKDPKPGKQPRDHFFVLGTQGVLEHSGVKASFWAITDMGIFEDVPGIGRFYVTFEGELRLLLTRMAVLPQIMTKQFRKLSLVRVNMQGPSDFVPGMHLHRCANCNIPLLYPLVSKTENGLLKQCYCSRDCQVEHWPAFIAANSPIPAEPSETGKLAVAS
jgi:hypothetical protein